MILNFDEMNEDLDFLLSRCGEIIEDSIEIPQNVMEWYENQNYESKETGYLVKYQNQFGYLYNEEFNHDEVEDKSDANMAIHRGNTSEKVYKEINEKLKQFDENTEGTFITSAGYKSSYLSMHELFLFIPLNTSESTYMELVQKLQNTL